MTQNHPTRQTFDRVMVPNYAPAAVIPVRGKGSRLWDQEDREYVDLAGGIAVNSLGHCHPELVDTLKQQADQLWHLANVFTNEPALNLAQTLCDKTFGDRVYFCNSGAEANEAAFKLARRKAWSDVGEQKHRILSARGSFHGRTLFTVTVGGQEKYTEGFRPAPEGITHLPYNDIAALEAEIDDNTCAVVLEPLQGEGGVRPAEQGYLEAARRLCDQYGALLIFDEVQTGVGRCGALYAYMVYGVTPDVMTTAKSLGGGFPIGAMIATEEAANALTVGTHGSTYGGNPLACAVASKVLEIVERPETQANVTARHDQLSAGLKQLNDKHGVFRDIRGMGLLMGAELEEQWAGKAKLFLQAALSEGLMILVAGPDVLRFAPSLLVTEADIALALEQLDRAIVQVKAQSEAA